MHLSIAGISMLLQKILSRIMWPIHLPTITSSANPPAAAPRITILEVLLLSSGSGCAVFCSVLGVYGSALAESDRIMDLNTIQYTTKIIDYSILSIL